MDIRPFWVWLQIALGVRVRADEMLSAFDSPKAIYEASSVERKLSGVFTQKQIERLEKTKIEKADSIVRLCDENNWGIVTPDSSLYPSLLLQIGDYPLALYVWGDLSCLKNRVSIAVVGTRSASRHSIDVAGRLCASIARAGAVVVSGGALGVDSAAHTGAMFGKGKTVAVLGCGLAARYLMDNHAMRDNISKNGAVISEYPPETPPMGQNFPIRNRIISGLSLGTVVIEAGERSGSLITARLAAEQGRDVFAVPGDVISSCYTGANRLIADGARPIFSAADILFDYAVSYPEVLDINKIERTLDGENVPLSGVVSSTKPRPDRTVPYDHKQISYEHKPTSYDSKTLPCDHMPTAELQKARHPKTLEGNFDEGTKTVYSCFGENSMSTDEIVLKSGMNISEVLEALIELEIIGVVEQKAGKIYALK